MNLTTYSYFFSQMNNANNALIPSTTVVFFPSITDLALARRCIPHVDLLVWNSSLHRRHCRCSPNSDFRNAVALLPIPYHCRSGFSVLPMGCSVTRNGAIGYCVFTKPMPTVVRDSHRTKQSGAVANLEPGLQADLSLWDHQTAQR